MIYTLLDKYTTQKISIYIIALLFYILIYNSLKQYTRFSKCLIILFILDIFIYFYNMEKKANKLPKRKKNRVNKRKIRRNKLKYTLSESKPHKQEVNLPVYKPEIPIYDCTAGDQ